MKIPILQQFHNDMGTFIQRERDMQEMAICWVYPYPNFLLTRPPPQNVAFCLSDLSYDWFDDSSEMTAIKILF